MSENHDYIFKIANHPQEFQQIHQLNYQTFVKEIPQHHENEQEMLIDPYNDENTYIICIKETQVIGMIAIRDKRPFSLDKKIGQVEAALPKHIEAKKPCEIRLLSVAKEYRHGRVFLGLAQFLARYSLRKGFDAAVISGTTRQLKLYRQMGFEPFAHLVGSEDAQYQPMYLTKETFDQSLAGRIIKPMIHFLPGPVPILPEIKAAFAAEPISHRSEAFIDHLTNTKKRLCQITNSQHVQILLGSGTLANDMIGAQLSLLNKPGLILINGEFGTRLKLQAERFGLIFDTIEKDWGQPILPQEILGKIKTDQTPPAWIWMVHSETSTGILNDLDAVKAIAAQHDIKLCVDCISSLGTVPIDLAGVYLASGVSGKALGAFTGLSFVFHQHHVMPSKRLPNYIDLGLYEDNDSIPFSHSSNLINALHTAIQMDNDARIRKINQRYHLIRNHLEERGMEILAPINHASPIIMTVVIPKSISSTAIGELIRYQGYQLHYRSDYLRERNWIQIATIGDYDVEDIEKMVSLLENVTQYEQLAMTNEITI
ncbi:aminotransferase class V-fold PLP-dependent enzyme [Bacillus marasmi]|uniref:aminotransferase class V-fold PLP-dependent enzyme n=1 Tax=Bacillus marasmi TaxID=1926279 RepID=UPI0011CA66DE|nr:aminotransferase class V-fold PLP-dependent enzyme [Bacillus marasmi]